MALKYRQSPQLKTVAKGFNLEVPSATCLLSVSTLRLAAGDQIPLWCVTTQACSNAQLSFCSSTLVSHVNFWLHPDSQCATKWHHEFPLPTGNQEQRACGGIHLPVQALKNRSILDPLALASHMLCKAQNTTIMWTALATLTSRQVYRHRQQVFRCPEADSTTIWQLLSL